MWDIAKTKRQAHLTLSSVFCYYCVICVVSYVDPPSFIVKSAWCFITFISFGSLLLDFNVLKQGRKIIFGLEALLLLKETNIRRVWRPTHLLHTLVSSFLIMPNTFHSLNCFKNTVLLYGSPNLTHFFHASELDMT